MPLRLPNGFRLFAKTYLHPPQRTIVDVYDPGPADRGRIDVQRVAAEKMVVQERGGEVVGGGDGMEVAREVDVDLLHGQDLAQAAAGGAALEAEDRAE